MSNAELPVQVGLWVMVGFTVLFLSLRIYSKLSRHRALWWDDYALVAAWVMVVIGSGFISAFAAPSSGIVTASSDRVLLLFNICSMFCALASAWSKSAFALTLTRLTERAGTIFLWFIIATVNIAYTVFSISAWGRPCVVQSNSHMYLAGACWSPTAKIAVPLAVVLYSSLMDFTLALFPWKILWHTDMKNREKVGLGIAMSFGVLAGIIAVKRAVNMLGVDPVANGSYYHGRVIQCIWNVAEPCVTIVAQCIPTLRALLVDRKSRKLDADSAETYEEILKQQTVRCWNGSSHAISSSDHDFQSPSES
ncbi:hypothetical protein JX266_012362 [Neoarthrinium moseri]|nr:hypothetical protein JX266_012362 [Neoarthrinium moseri]